MKLITIRNIPPHLVRIIRRKAEADGVSINKTVLSLLDERAGVSKKKPRRPLHHDLDALAGSWTAREASAFDKALAEQRQIDPDLWK
jgi:hypothetical protein